MTQKNNIMHWVLGGALLLIGLFVIIALVLTRSQAADDVTTTLNVNNTAPSVTGVKVCLGSGADPATCNHENAIHPNTEASSDIYSLVGLITDTNGVSDLDSLEVKFFRYSLLTESDTANANNRYLVSDDLTNPSNCTITDGPTASTQKYFRCEISLPYYIDATYGGSVNNGTFDSDIWQLLATVTDSSAETGSGARNSEVYTNLSINTCGSVDYGSMGLGDSTTIAVECPVASWSNMHVDLYASATALDCAANGGIGQIDASRQRISSDNASYNAMVSKLDLSGIPTDFNYLDLHHRISGEDTGVVTDTLYHGVWLPSEGLSGTCTGTETLTARAGVLD